MGDSSKKYASFVTEFHHLYILLVEVWFILKSQGAECVTKRTLVCPYKRSIRLQVPPNTHS